jgi:hypothetical protein
MDWSAAIERNREALNRIVVSLVVMAGLANGQSAIASRQSGPAQAADGPTTPDCRLPTGNCRITLSRHLHRAVIRLLRPAEAAVRRLIIVAARGLAVALPPLRPRKPKPMTAAPLLRSLGLAVVMSPADIARAVAAERAGAIRAARRRSLSLPLLDPLPRPFRRYCPTVPPHAAPRISAPGVDAPFHRLPPPPSPHDPVSAARLVSRLQALAAALDDLPGQARRFARWRARRDAAVARDRGAYSAGRVRLWPLKPGRPPGWRRKPGHEVHEVLDVVHGLAFWALEAPDTS